MVMETPHWYGLVFVAVAERPTEALQELTKTAQSKRSWNGQLELASYSTFKITGKINCVFTGIPRLMAGFT